MKRVSGKEFCKILEKHGWIYVRTRGSHRFYKPPEHLKHLQQVSVPIHTNKTLPIGTQSSLMKKTGIKAADL